MSLKRFRKKSLRDKIEEGMSNKEIKKETEKIEKSSKKPKKKSKK